MTHFPVASKRPEKGIYWLASYPKSGNTWTRAFIANLLNDSSDPVDINDLATGAIASSYEWVEDALGFEIGELSQDEIDRLRHDAYRWHGQHAETASYHKVHDAYMFLPTGRPLFPPEATRGVLYIVRNPLDVAISFAHHSHGSIDQAIANMANLDFAFCGKHQKRHNQLRQKLLSWSEHVTSWTEAPGLPLLLVRYEDMQTRPLQMFTRIARFLELPSDQHAVQRALNHCRMDRLQQQEKEHGFKEKMPRAKSFFRKGIVGDWVNTLTDCQIATIVGNHRRVMAKLGYIDASNMPVECFEHAEAIS